MSKLKGALVALLLLSAISTSVFAKTKKEHVTLSSDVKVNGTLVKKGMYDVVFDDESNELSIVKENKVIAKVMARVESRESKARVSTLRTIRSGEETELLGVTFGGSKEDVVVNQPSMQAGGNN